MPGMLGRPFSFFPKRRPMDDLILFFLAALLRESWLLLLLLGLLPWPSWSPARLWGGGGAHGERVRHPARGAEQNGSSHPSGARLTLECLGCPRGWRRGRRPC